MSENIIMRLCGVCFGYDVNAPVLHGIDLNIKRQSITAIVGPNGCGKSTLLKCMAKQLTSYVGDISYEERDIKAIGAKEYARLCSYLKQEREAPSITVKSLVRHGRFPYMGFPRSLTQNDAGIADEAMKRVNIYAYRERELLSLSGGERQKAYIAMAVAQQAELILLDEPTTYLDISRQLEVLEILRELKRQGKTVVAVLHDLNSAFELCDNIFLIENGKGEFFKSPEELINSGKIEKAFGVSMKTIEIDGKPHAVFSVKKQSAVHQEMSDDSFTASTFREGKEK